MKNTTNIENNVLEDSLGLRPIPKRQENGCPNGTQDGKTTCFCEDHCSWNMCRLSEPPTCQLDFETTKVEWAWSPSKSNWIAQGRQ